MSATLNIQEELGRMRQRLEGLQQELQQLETNCDLLKGRIVTHKEQLKETNGARRSLRGALVELTSAFEYLTKKSEEVDEEESDTDFGDLD